MTAPNTARAAAGLEPMPAMYLFTGETNVVTARRERYGHGGTKSYHAPSVAVTVLAADQADAERIAGAMLSTPDDTPEGASGMYIDTHVRHFTWSSVEHAPAGTAEAEQIRQELTRSVAQLDEAQSAGRITLQQAEAERERGDEYMRVIDRIAALTFAADDGTEYEHNGHGPTEGEPECPGCWVASIRLALEGGRVRPIHRPVR